MWTGQSGTAILSGAKAGHGQHPLLDWQHQQDFVAALALRLAEQGTISLNDPLSKYVPTFPMPATSR